MTGREVMKRLSKLRDDQLDDELMVYHRDIDRYFEVSSFEISKGDEVLDPEQVFIVT